MNIDRVRVKAKAVARYRERLDFIEQDDRDAVHRQFWERLLEQLGDRLLAAPERGTGEGVRVHFVALLPGSCFAIWFASPRARVVLPVPGAPVSRMRPCSGAASNDSF